MNIGGSWDESPLSAATRDLARAAIHGALECGINFFDHADFYCRGKSEEVFGEFLAENPGMRDELIVQSKCGIILPENGLPGRFDFSCDHITKSVQGSLRRLKTEYLDVLLLHRPDPLIDPEEVAKAFDLLHRSGRVRQFGVSNHSPAQMALLSAFLDQPIVANQIEYNPLHAVLHDTAIHANMRRPQYGTPGEGIIEYCRIHGIELQAYSPLAKGLLSGTALPPDAEPRVKTTATVVQQLANEHGVAREAIVIAWILRHPAGIAPVIGTTNPTRIRACAEAARIELSRVEWYQIYTAALGHPAP
jgi:predicted oxidoreductase